MSKVSNSKYYAVVFPKEIHCPISKGTLKVFKMLDAVFDNFFEAGEHALFLEINDYQVMPYADATKLVKETFGLKQGERVC